MHQAILLCDWLVSQILFDTPSQCYCVGIEHFNLRLDCILHTTDKITPIECIRQSFYVISKFLKLCLILSHSASLVKFSECSCEVIKITRAKSLQKELAKICAPWLFMSLDVPTKPLKGFMFQMKYASGTLLKSKVLCILKYYSTLYIHPVGSSPFKQGSQSLAHENCWKK